MALSVSTRQLGKRKPLLDDFSVPPPTLEPGGDNIRLRDLIEHVVRHEVRAFKRRQDSRRFDRILSDTQIAQGAQAGKVDPASKEYAQEVDVESAIGSALQAFEDGMYLVIIDEIERRSLDEQVRLSDESRLAFIRLTFLAGA